MSGQSYWERQIPWTFRDIRNRPSYSERRRMRYRLQDYMQSVIPFGRYSGRRVLEVGCGSGIDAAEFAKNGAEVTACDSSRLAIEETKKTLSEAKVKASVCFQHATALRFDDESFDLVYSFGVLHHLPNPSLAVAEFHRVLRPGGLCIVMLYHKDSLLYAYSIEHKGMSFERIPDAPYAEAYTAQQAKELFSQFSDVGVSVHYNVIDLPGKRKTKLNISDDLELGWHLIMKARK